jgi:hypothetical protein
VASFASASNARGILQISSQIFLVPKPPQPDEGFGLNMPVLDALGSPNSEGSSDVIPDFTVVEGPPLPAAVLAAEAADDLLAARVGADVLGYV